MSNLNEKSIVKMSMMAKRKNAITKAAIFMAKEKDPAVYEKMMKFYKAYKVLKIKMIKKYASKAKSTVLARK